MSSLLLDIASSELFPFIVLFLIPALAFVLAARTRTRTRRSGARGLAMVLESLLPWGWFSGSGKERETRTSQHRHGHRKTKTRHAERRGEETEMSGMDRDGQLCEDGYYPGLVNISGTYCFMNSTLQALASLSYLQPQINAVHAKAEALDVPTPVIDVLKGLFSQLNMPRASPSSIRPLDLISVLSSGGRGNSLLSSREHQDAQELFQLLSECLKNEITSVDSEVTKDTGLRGLSPPPTASSSTSTSADAGKLRKSVFDGLTAHRRSCVLCGYTEAVMHFPFDNWQLSVPMMSSACRLEDLLEDYTRLEVLRDCICRRCSMKATHVRLKQEMQTLSEASNPSASKKRRLKDVKKMEARVKVALDEGRVEDELKDVRMEKVFGVSTKQAMVARPPPVLALHINRSMHTSYYATKNNIRVIFPEVLDLTPFTTSGSLSTVPTSSMSTSQPLPPRARTPTQTRYEGMRGRTLYRLAAVVCHYGAHSFGHYVCFRRKPQPGRGWRPPKLVLRAAHQPRPETSNAEGKKKAENGSADPGDEQEVDGLEEYAWEDGPPEAGSGRGWLRTSDDAVVECGIESVLREASGAFMLYYERVVVSVPVSDAQYLAGGGVALSSEGYGFGVKSSEGLSSEETLKPEVVVQNGHAHGHALGPSVGLAVGGARRSTPRIVRSVTRSRSVSVAPRSGSPVSLAPSISTTVSTSAPVSLVIPNGKHAERAEGEEATLSRSAPAEIPLSKERKDAANVDVDGGVDDPPASASPTKSLPPSHHRQPHNHKPKKHHR